MMFIPSSLALYAGPGYGRESSLYCGKRGGTTWGIGICTCCTSPPFVLAFLVVLCIPFLGCFMCPLAVAGLRFKYLVTSSSERLVLSVRLLKEKIFWGYTLLGVQI